MRNSSEVSAILFYILVRSIQVILILSKCIAQWFINVAVMYLRSTARRYGPFLCR